MYCVVCSYPNCNGIPTATPLSSVTMPLPQYFKTCLTIPCFVRDQLLSSIYELKRQFMEEEGFDVDLVFLTREDLEYPMEVTHAVVRTIMHGSGWTKLVTDYDLGYRDLITIDLGSDNLKIEIDLKLNESRGGHRPFPKAYCALEGPHDHERRYIETKVYTLGVQLSFLQLHQLTDDVIFSSTLLDITPGVHSPTMPFVHRLNATNLTTGYLKIPAAVTEVLISKLRYLPRKGTTCLASLDVYDEVVKTTCNYTLLKDKRMDIKGFEDIACIAKLRVSSIVVVTIEKKCPRIGDLTLLKLVIYNLDRWL